MTSRQNHGAKIQIHIAACNWRDGRSQSEGGSRFLSRRSAKHQAPNPKLQRSSKSQTPNSKSKCRGKRRAGRFLSLELGASLELGVWNLELVAWALSFSKIEMRPARPAARAHLDSTTRARSDTPSPREGRAGRGVCTCSNHAVG